MPEQNLKGHPHRMDYFWRLLGLYGRQSRPASDFFDDAAGDDLIAEQRMQAAINKLFLLGVDRRRRYDVFDEMDTYGLVSAILDVYAEEATQMDFDKGRSVWVESRSTELREAAEDVLHNCQVEDRAAAIARRTCKYGDAFQRLMYQTGAGVLGWRYERQHDIERVEDKYSRLVGFKQDSRKFRAGKRDISWPWDYVHFRLLGKNEEEGYGTSLLEGMFREWRRMTLTEESIMLFRLRRVPDRNLVMVNVGNMEESEALQYVNAWRKRFRKHELVDPASPDYQKQYNPLTPLEDVFVPMIEGRESRIETLAGSGNIGEIYDLEHFRDAFFGSAKAPKAYFGYEGDINAKATLIQQDVRFARGCKRIQRSQVYGYRQLVDVHLALLQKPGEAERFPRDPEAYLIRMSPISYLDEFERLNLIQLRYQIVESMSRLATDMQLDPRVWATYILLNFARLPEEMVLRLIKKTPDEAPPMAAAGPGFEALSKEQKDQILDRDAQQRRGYIQLTEQEQLAIARCVHDSPALRRSIATFAEYAQEPDVFGAGSRQIDPALSELRIGGHVEDSVNNSSEAQQLAEDLAELRSATPDGRDIVVEG